MAVTEAKKPTSQSRETKSKHDEITRLLGELSADLSKKNLLPKQRDATLEALKLYTRSTDGADPLFTKEGVTTICKHSFDGSSLKTSREAMKCLANVMLLEAKTRQIFVDLGYAPKAAEKLTVDNRDDELLASRVLFLCTYDTNLDFDILFDHHQLTDSINTNLARHAARYSKSSHKHPPPAQDVLALSETLKLLFNLTQYYPHHAADFTKALPHILKILSKAGIPSPPLQPPVTYLINSMLNLDLEDKTSKYFSHHSLFPKLDARFNADHLINILDSAVRRYKEEQLEQLAAPLVSLIRKIYSFAPDGVKGYMRWLLLPSSDERKKPLGKSDTLAAFLLRLSTSPAAPTLRESIASMMFELSGRDATNFVRNVGYGFAAGFLMTHNLSVPENALDAWSSTDDDNNNNRKPSGKVAKEEEDDDLGEKVTTVDGVEINPITGQRRDMEPQPEGPEMTDAEKEREAERLFVLFERLKATGVVKVANPVEQALQEGRFEEIE